MPETPLRILHVEDVAADAELAERELVKAGIEFEILRVETREAFLAALADFGPDLILSDYRLPDFDGMQALLLTQEHAPMVPVIITTGTVNEETAVACMKAGAADYVLKEHLGRLGSAVQSALERKRLAEDRRRAEEALRESEDRYRSLFATSLDAVLLTTPGGEILAANTAACRMFGRSEEDLMRVGRAGVVDRSDPRVQAGLGERDRTGTFHGEITLLRKDGTKIAGEISTAVFTDRHEEQRTSMVIRDVTDRREAEEEKARLLAIIEESPDFIGLADLQGNLMYHNRAAKRMVGLPEDADLGHLKIGDMHPGWAAKRVIEEGIPTVLREGTWRSESVLLHRNGSEIPVSQVLVVHRNATGEPELVSTIMRDISEMKRLEAQFRQAQKMEAVGRLAGGVAHDFNNLLTVIQGYGELLAKSLEGDPEKRENMGEIVKAAERAAALTRQLLAFSRRQVLEMRILDLGAVVADTEKMLRRLIGEDVEVVVVKPATLGRVKADPGQIEQVLLNLAVNSRDAMPGGGRLTVELADVNLDAPLTTSHDSIPSGRYVVVSVHDTGNGMDAETFSHLFEPFFTTKEKGKGTGLGLATVFGIVKQSGGYVDVASVPGAGTTFRIYLPRSDARTTSGVRPRGSSRAGSETVLVVEDEAAVRNLVRAVLERKGYVVLAAQDGAAALELVDKYPGVIHVLLTDVVMPGMNGRELAALVTARRPKVKVIFMSGYTADVAAELGAEGGPAFLSKPFNERTLTAKLREVLDTPPV